MRHIIFRLFLIFIAFILLFTYVFPWHSYGIQVPFSGKEYKLWLDLQWWIELDYRVDLSEAKEEEGYNSSKENEIIEWLKSIIDRRIEALNINDSEINDASYAGERHIIVQIPLKWNDDLENSDNIEKAKAAIWRVVKISFKEMRWEITQESIDERINIAENAFEEFESWEDFWVISDKYTINYEKTQSSVVSDINSIISSTWSISSSELNEVTMTNWDEGFLIYDFNEEEETYEYLFISSTPSEWVNATDSNGRVLDDTYFSNSSVQYNEAYRPMVELVFNSEWAEIFWELSSRLVWQQMAIFVWWELLTAPVINQPIYWGKAVITWDYTPEEATQLSRNINTWVVPAPIYLTSERVIDSKIWWDSLKQLIVAWISGFLLIFAFLIYSYRLSWLAASIALFIYVLIVLSVVKVLWVTLTLASVAGLILSIWMAIDANILIFERVKHELRNWHDIKKSTLTWYKKSFSAIWDSNITWLIVSLILFIFWINLIKWFWLMLGLWIIISLFTVMWVSKVFIVYLSNKLNNKNIFIWMK